MSWSVNAIELWIVGPGIHALVARAYSESPAHGRFGDRTPCSGSRDSLPEWRAATVEPPSSMSGKIDSPILALSKSGVNLRLRSYIESLLPSQRVQISDVDHLILLRVIKDKMPAATMAGETDINLSV